MTAEHFGRSARRLAGVAGAVLGWRPEEFWSATPDELMTIFQIFAAQHEPDALAGKADLARLMEMFPDG
ncbi:MAG: phage tail assembly chaperone [Sphingomonadaceae bacterium]